MLCSSQNNLSHRSDHLFLLVLHITNYFHLFSILLVKISKKIPSPYSMRCILVQKKIPSIKCLVDYRVDFTRYQIGNILLSLKYNAKKSLKKTKNSTFRRFTLFYLTCVVVYLRYNIPPITQLLKLILSVIFLISILLNKLE